MCCGTHVANTSHLQTIKLLGLEKGKKGKTNLLFVSGGRVLKYLNGCLENERALTGSTTTTTKKANACRYTRGEFIEHLWVLLTFKTTQAC